MINVISLTSCHKLLILIVIIAPIFSFVIISEQLVVYVLTKEDCDKKDADVIIGTRTTTIGTKCNDVIVGCPFSPLNTGPGRCSTGDLVRGLEKDDVIQGSEGNDVLYGDDGNDKITGGGGSDRLFGDPGDDILKVNAGSNFLVGGKGDDELYGGLGSDVFIGGKGADTFDCGENFDIVIDFDLDDGDIQNNNCEVIESYHDDMDIFAQPSKIKSHLDKFGTGSSQDKIDIDDIGKEID
ncbi:MAG TPA: calcium-binding protein [Nitrososphaeraceae archaeon]|nr:calcium-binding protein [Nitrososphaeraceae archaeon]